MIDIMFSMTSAYEALVARRVSNTWNKLLMNSEPIFSILTFPNHHHIVELDHFAEALERVKRLMAVTVCNLGQESGDILMHVLREMRLSSLRILDLAGPWFIPETLLVDTYNLKSLHIDDMREFSIDMSSVSKIVRDCKCLHDGWFKHIRSSSALRPSLHDTSIQTLA
jgi:hypothetical protein